MTFNFFLCWPLPLSSRALSIIRRFCYFFTLFISPFLKLLNLPFGSFEASSFFPWNKEFSRILFSCIVLSHASWFSECPHPFLGFNSLQSWRSPNLYVPPAKVSLLFSFSTHMPAGYLHQISHRYLHVHCFLLSFWIIKDLYLFIFFL